MIHLITNNTVYILMAVHSFVGKDRRRLLDHFFFYFNLGLDFYQFSKFK